MKIIEKILYVFSALALILFILSCFDSEYLTSFLSALVGLSTIMVAKAANSSTKAANDFFKNAQEKEELRDLPFIAPMFHSPSHSSREYRNNHNVITYTPNGTENIVYFGIRNIGKGTAININFIDGIEQHPGISFLEPDTSWPLGDILSNNIIPTGRTFRVLAEAIPELNTSHEFLIRYKGILGEEILTSFTIIRTSVNKLLISKIRKTVSE